MGRAPRNLQPRLPTTGAVLICPVCKHAWPNEVSLRVRYNVWSCDHCDNGTVPIVGMSVRLARVRA